MFTASDKVMGFVQVSRKPGLRRVRATLWDAKTGQLIKFQEYPAVGAVAWNQDRSRCAFMALDPEDPVWGTLPDSMAQVA